MNPETTKGRAGPQQFTPKGDMSEEHCKAATRMIQFHASNEVVGGYPEKLLIRQVPNIDRELTSSAKVQDKVDHTQLLYHAAEPLDTGTRDGMPGKLTYNDGKSLSCFHYPMESWHKVPMIAFFIDGVAIHRRTTLKNTSWTSYARMMDKMCFEEGFHAKRGESILSESVNGSKAIQEKVRAAFEMWWSRIIRFFGPTNDKSIRNDFAQEVGLKTRSNNEFRDIFLDIYVLKTEKYDPIVPEYLYTEYGEELDTYHVSEDDLSWDESRTIAKDTSDGSYE